MDRLDVIEQVTLCTRCELVNNCRGPVSMTGKAPATIVAIGEAPGGEEDKQGRPFVGPAGKWLRTRLTEVGIDPEAMAYMNVVSCFPHGTPEAKHIEACEPNRVAQLELLDPDWILLVGGVALSAWRPDLKVSQTHGRPLVLDGRVAFSCFHPSAAMRRTSYDRELRADLARFRQMMDGGKENWWKHVSEQCLMRDCGTLAVWYDQERLGWCEKHLPPEGKERLALVDNEYLRLAGKPLIVTEDPEYQVGPDGKKWKNKCGCGMHPHAGHKAEPMA